MKNFFEPVYVAVLTDCNRSTDDIDTTITVVSAAGESLEHFESFLLKNFGHFCNWNDADVKRDFVVESTLTVKKNSRFNAMLGIDKVAFRY